MSRDRKHRRALRAGLYARPQNQPTGDMGGMRFWDVQEFSCGSVRGHHKYDDQVHAVFKVESLNHPIVLRLVSPEQADQMIATLESHRFEVWPELSHPIDAGAKSAELASELEVVGFIQDTVAKFGEVLNDFATWQQQTGYSQYDPSEQVRLYREELERRKANVTRAQGG